MGQIRRRFSAEFKRGLVLRIETGELSGERSDPGVPGGARSDQSLETTVCAQRTVRPRLESGTGAEEREPATEGEDRGTGPGNGSFKKTTRLDGPESKRRYCRDHWRELGTVSKGCEVTGVARSTYYYKPKVDPKIRVQQDLDLRDRIEAILAMVIRSSIYARRSLSLATIRRAH